MPVAPGSLLGRYHIISPLGVGGMGEVYLAKDTQLGRQVAIKFPTVKSDEHHTHARFLREARSVSLLNHRNIATIYDYGETEAGQPYLVMELIKGESLSELMHSSTLTLTRSIEIIADVAEALSEAHRAGIIHRDIKPSNVMINDRDEVKVLDFGLAKQLHEDAIGDVDQNAETLLATSTKSGVVVGTPLYLSPEQATSMPVDARSDIFALGSLLYECITGRSAFSGNGVIAITAQIIHVDPPLPISINENVSPELERITLKALAKKPEERYQSVTEMCSDLRAVRGDIRSTGATVTQNIGRVPQTLRSSAFITLSEVLRRPRLSLASALIGLTILAGGIWGVVSLRKGSIHVPLSDAQRLYDVGTNALREGAYYQASIAFENAVKIDSKFALAYARLAEAWTELDYSDKAKDALLQSSALMPDRSVLPPIEALYLDAINATVRRDFEQAIKSYGDIVKLTPDHPQAYFDLGRAYERNDETQKAIDQYIEATKRDQLYAAAFLRVGVLYGRKGDLDTAASTFKKAETVYESLGKTEGRTEVLYQRGLLYRNVGRASDAHLQTQQALDNAKTTGNQFQQIKALLLLSNISIVENNITQSQQYAQEAMAQAQVIGLESLVANGFIDLGNTFFRQDKLLDAEQYFKQALELARRFKLRITEARALLSLGSLRMRQDNADETILFTQQALPLYQQGGYRVEVATAFTLLAQARELKGDYNGVVATYKEQLQQAQSVGDHRQEAISNQNIGIALANQENYKEAQKYIDESHSIFKSLGGYQLEIGYNLLYRGDLLWRLGRYPESRTALDSALEIARQPDSNYKPLLARIYLSQAQLALSERQFGDVKAKSLLALTLPDTGVIAIEAQHTSALALALSGSTKLGLSTCKEAVEKAKNAFDPRLLARSQIALAEVMLESGDARNALDTALKAEEEFVRFAQQDSEWRAAMVAVRASRLLKDTTTEQAQLTRLKNIFSGLQQKWGAEAFNSYLSRPDVIFYRKKLNEEFNSAK